MKEPAVYILASHRNGTLYVGVTADIRARIQQHRDGAGSSFTARYDVKTLVHFEFFADMPTAIRREKQLKKWNRRWKIRLIESRNPDWRDLWKEIV
ncbi:MAG: GIY-YIG nuclease family protein [Gammaproteobacteria bacterium]|nr:GIY-YIG nuclease family protein [Gammaproteobacteria bacterium]